MTAGRADLAVPAAEARRRLDGAPVEPEPVEEVNCLLRTGEDTLEWLTVRLMSIGCGFRVEGPPELVGHLREPGERITRAAGGPGAG